MKTKTPFISSFHKVVSTALVLLVATTSVGYADFNTVRTKIQNMIASDSGDFGYIITNIFDPITGLLKEEFVPPISPIWNLVGNDIYYNTGSVGIGTTSPSAKLEVNASYGDKAIFRSSDNSRSLILGHNDYESYLTVSNGDNFLINNNSGTPFFIENSGNIGIGNTNPLTTLHVNRKASDGSSYNSISIGSSPDGGQGGSTELNFVGHGTSGDGAYIDYSRDNGRDLIIRSVETDAAGNESGHTTVMIIDSNGNITVPGAINASCIGNCF